MSAHLRDLELIPADEIGDGDPAKFVRAASVDSPFREQIAWAFVQIAGRPAVPDRDLESWIEEIKARVAEAKPKP
jgi:CTP synthase